MKLKNLFPNSGNQFNSAQFAQAIKFLLAYMLHSPNSKYLNIFQWDNTNYNIKYALMTKLVTISTNQLYLRSDYIKKNTVVNSIIFRIICSKWKHHKTNWTYGHSTTFYNWFFHFQMDELFKI